MTDKATLRRLANMLSPASPDESERVCRRLVDVLDGARMGCLYLPMPGELDLTSLPERRRDVVWHTTRTVDRVTLSVHPIESELETHPFGYSQPIEGSPQVDPAEIDVWLVPGLAFDIRGHRLGHGAGYYDRLLVRAGLQARFVAPTMERRIFPSIPVDEYDIGMDVIVTEDRVITP